MRLVVLIKQVVDITNPFNLSINRQEIVDETKMLNPWDEFAIEAALQQKDLTGAEVIALTAGPVEAEEALRPALAMGCDRVIRVDCEVHSLDSLQIAHVLAAAIQEIGAVDLLFFGKQSSDFENALIPALTAQILKWPYFSLVSTIKELDVQQIIVERHAEGMESTESASLPAAVSINKNFGEPRFPSFMGTRKAAKAIISTLSLNDLNINLQPTKFPPEFEMLPPRKLQFEMITGESAQEKVSNIIQKIRAEGK